MHKTTISRKIRREEVEKLRYLVQILNDFSDNELYDINLKSLIAIRISIEEMVRLVNIGQRYIAQPHIYVNAHDDTASTMSKNTESNSH